MRDIQTGVELNEEGRCVLGGDSINWRLYCADLNADLCIAKRELNEARQERDRYKATLQRIARSGCHNNAMRIAREVLGE